MTVTKNGRPTPGTAAQDDASTTIIPQSSQADKLSDEPGTPGVEWYMRLDRYVHANPDWTHRWSADHVGQPAGTVMAKYRTLANALFAHPDRERGAALAWQLHDMIHARIADKTWRLLHPDNIGNAQRQFIHERVASGIGSDIYSRARQR